MPIWIIGIFVVRGVGTFVSSYGIAYIGRNVVQAMQRDVFAAYLRLPAAFFGAEPSGHQISRITYTSEQVAAASTDAVKIGDDRRRHRDRHVCGDAAQQRLPHPGAADAWCRRSP